MTTQTQTQNTQATDDVDVAALLAANPRGVRAYAVSPRPAVRPGMTTTYPRTYGTEQTETGVVTRPCARCGQAWPFATDDLTDVCGVCLAPRR